MRILYVEGFTCTREHVSRLLISFAPYKLELLEATFGLHYDTAIVTPRVVL